MGFADFAADIATNPNAGYNTGSGFDKTPLPIGDYDFVITKATIKGYVSGLKGEGSMKQENIAAYLHEHPEIQVGEKLQLECEITAGEYKGRKEWFTFLITPSSDQLPTGKWKSVDAMIGMEKNKFAGLLKRCNISQITTPEELLGATFRVHAILSSDAKRNFFNLEIKKDEVIGRPGTNVGTAPVRADEAPF